MTTLKSSMTNIGPINAMPFKENINQCEMADKIERHLRHPVTQQASHVANVVPKVRKEANLDEEPVAEKKHKKKTLILE